MPVPSLPRGCCLKNEDFLDCNKAGLKEISGDIPLNVTSIDLSQNPLLQFQENYFLRFPNLMKLVLDDCNLKEPFSIPATLTDIRLKRNLFTTASFQAIIETNSSKLYHIEMSQNNLDLEYLLKFLPENITVVYADGNKLQTIKQSSFNRFSRLQILSLYGCGINVVEKSSFNSLYNLNMLDLSQNQCESIPDHLFKFTKKLHRLYLRGNKMTSVSDIQGPIEYLTVDMRENKIIKITSKNFKNVSISRLLLGNNAIQSFDLANAKFLIVDLSFNRIKGLGPFAFKGKTALFNINLENNHLEYISPLAFKGMSQIGSLHLHQNNIKDLPKRIFSKMSIKTLFLNGNKLSSMRGVLDNMKSPPNTLMLYNNPRLTTLQKEDYRTMSKTSKLYVSCNMLKNITGNTNLNATIICYPTLGFQVHDNGCTLEGRGYKCSHQRYGCMCVPCQQGYINNENYCNQCPPGSFYQDQLASLQCKNCLAGQYVPPNRAPGKSPSDCLTCPDGTQKNNSAGYRACKCLDGFARVCRFGECTKCDQLGITCKRDYQMLERGFWWIWHAMSPSNTTCKNSFISFMKNLDTESDGYSRTSSKFECSLPQPHPCPIKGSCLGGVNASCQSNYTGTLCSVCEKGYSRQFQKCVKCPKPAYSVIQFVSYIIVFLLICAVISWTDKVRIQVHEGHTRTFADIVLSNLKILVGFYQVLVVVMNVFSHVSLPHSFQKTIGVFQFMQLDIFHIPSLRCIRPEWRLNVVEEFWIAIIGTAVSPVMIFLYFVTKSVYLFFTRASREDFKEQRNICKKNCLRFLALFLFVTYPLTSQKIIQVLPISCHNICTIMKDGECLHHLFYMKADYSVKCLSLSDHSHLTLVIAYFSIIIPLGFPLLLFCLLHKYIREGSKQECNTEEEIELLIMSSNGRNCKNEESTLQFALKFLYENYDSSNRYWEPLEMIRKLIMTAGVTLFIGYYKTGIGVTIIIAGFFAILHSFRRPVKDRFENIIQLLSLCIIPVNLCIGAILSSNNSDNSSPAKNNAVIGYILVALNLVIVVVVVARLFSIIVKTAGSIYNAVSQCFKRCCAFSRSKTESVIAPLL
eukprot:gene626-1291_t